MVQEQQKLKADRKKERQKGRSRTLPTDEADESYDTAHPCASTVEAARQPSGSIGKSVARSHEGGSNDEELRNGQGLSAEIDSESAKAESASYFTAQEQPSGSFSSADKSLAADSPESHPGTNHPANGIHLNGSNDVEETESSDASSPATRAEHCEVAEPSTLPSQYTSSDSDTEDSPDIKRSGNEAMQNGIETTEPRTEDCNPETSAASEQGAQAQQSSALNQHAMPPDADGHLTSEPNGHQAREREVAGAVGDGLQEERGKTVGTVAPEATGQSEPASSEPLSPPLKVGFESPWSKACCRLQSTSPVAAIFTCLHTFVQRNYICTT